MGTLRLLLAFSVVYFHFGTPWGMFFIDGGAAVRCFFVLSGYAIALVLNEKYGERRMDFYFARARRIYPAYLVVLSLTLLWWYWLSNSAGTDSTQMRLWQSQAPTAGQSLWLVASQLSLVGLDWQAVWSIHPGATMEAYVAMPHAWSLAVELAFYALAPWVVRLPTQLLAFTAAAGLGLWYFIASEHGSFSNLAVMQAGYFALGILAYRFEAELTLSSRRRAQAAVGLFAAFWLLLALSEPGPLLPSLLVPLAVALLLPSLRLLGRSSLIDRRLGEISYSLYLIHPLLGWVLAPFFTQGLILLSLLAALLLWWAVDQPLRSNQGRT